MNVSCKTIRPKAKLKAESKGGSALWLSNVSNYQDLGCKEENRQSKWVFAKNGKVVKSLPLQLLPTVVPVGVGSDGTVLKLPNGAQDVFDYLTGLGINLNNGDVVQVGLYVKNCYNETSAISNLHTLPPFGGCIDCCCDNSPYYVFLVGGNEFCSTTQIAGSEYCLV